MPRVCVLDVNETLLDLSALDSIFERRFGDASVRRLWFSQVLQTALVSTITGVYRDFAKTGRAALEMTAARLGADLDEGTIDEVAATMRRLPPHPDVLPGLERLSDAGFRLVALTNSPLAVAEAQLTHAGIAPLLEAMMSAEEVQRLKPAPEPYHMTAERLGVTPDRLRMVAAHAWDVTGAIRAGCAAAFVSRPGAVLDPFGETPDIVEPDMGRVADAIIAAEGD